MSVPSGSRRSGLLYSLNLGFASGQLHEYLENSSFEEMMRIDVAADRISAVYHIEEKYSLPFTDGSYRAFFTHVLKRLVHPDDKAAYAALMDPNYLLENLSHGDIPWTSDVEYRCLQKSGAYHWVEQVMICGETFGLPEGTVECYIYDVQNFKDRTEGRTLVQKGSGVQPDALTGLLREADYVNAAGIVFYDSSARWAVIAVDLESFRLYNEWYGWEAGNRVLASVGTYLKETARSCGGFAGYMGGDDFLLLVPEGSVSPDDVYAQVHQIMGTYGVSVGFQPSVGVAVSEGGSGSSILALIDEAQLACDRAKENFRNRVVCYSSDMRDETGNEFRLLSDFHRAITQKSNIFFCLQPQCRVSTGRIVGAEALARWRQADGSFLSPEVFVPVLEKYGFITDLDQYVWESVAAWLSDYIDRGGEPVPVSVNVSQVDVFTIDVPAFFRGLMERYHLPPGLIKVEITESAVAGDSQKILTVIRELRSAGFTVLMDDFGSGYSSLNMLHELDMDVIKIDANFLRYDRQHEKKGIHIVESVISLAKSMGIPTVVEGVETREQVDFLRSLGCRYMQGYFYYQPMPKEDFEALIADPEKTDRSGINFKANEEFHLREFLNDNIYSDSMLNTILGPVAFYLRRGDRVDIIRYNEQFYDAVNIEGFSDRLNDIGRFVPPEEMESMLQALDEAVEDGMNGSSAVVSFYLPQGGASRFLMHFYYLGPWNGGDRFYGACRDVTDITTLQKTLDLITSVFSDCIVFVSSEGGVPRCQVVAQGIDELGLTRSELEEEMNSGRFFSRVLFSHRRMLRTQWEGMLKDIDFSAYFGWKNPRGRQINLHIETDLVEDDTVNVQHVVRLSEA